MAEQRKGSHTVSRLTVHIVWVTKYRYHFLKGEIQRLFVNECKRLDGQGIQGFVEQTI